MGLFKTLTRSSQQTFSIEIDEDYYVVVKLKNKLFCYTKQKSQAKEMIRKLEELCDWKKIKDLIQLRNDDPDFYDEKVRPILRMYAVPHKTNGNYLTTLDTSGIVTYRQDGRKVFGKHIIEGLAIRNEAGYVYLDNVYKGLAIVAMETEEQVMKFYNETKTVVPWHLEAIDVALQEEQKIGAYLSSVKTAILNHSSMPTVDLKAKFKFQYIVMGGDDKEKLEAYVSAMTKLHNMVGLDSVKNKMDEFLKVVSADKQLKDMNFTVGGDALHSLFVGPPGTGKTQLARIMSDLYWSLGLIPERKIIELSKEDLVSSYVGGTEEITKEKIESALGGILFVDEAYMLKGISGNPGDNNKDFGKIALEIIMRAMDNKLSNLVVIFAGYEKEIDELLNENPGLRSRFPLTFTFVSFTPLELAEIADRMITEKGFVTEQIKPNLQRLMSKKAKSGALQGNARDVRVIVEEIIRKHKVRIIDQSGSRTVIHSDDVDSLNETRKIKDNEGLNQLRKEAEVELNNLIGLNDIKEEIITWANYVAVEKKRIEESGDSEPIRLHMTFEGDPGVGKTTVARIIGKHLKGNGLLSGGFVEVLGKDLVAGYMGQTAPKVKDIVKRALGGVLFIDEAYSMVKGKDDMFGREAVDTLVAEMENNNGNLSVILAGYPKEIDELLKVNPGFPSRIAERFVFEDYNAAELTELFQLKLGKFTLDKGALETASSLINEAKQQNKVKGNGRWIGNLFDKIKKAQANRIMREGSKDYYLITSADIQAGYKRM